MSSCALHQIPAGSFADTLHASDWAAGSFPISASLELTAACNLKCRHCYLGYDGAVQPQKSTKEIERVLDILNELGVLFLVFTGGEPFSRPDFRQLYLKAKQNGFFMTLFSNGTLLDDSLMDFLADAPPRRLELTIYGHSEKVYEAVTGIPGSYKRFRYAVDGLLSRGLLVRLKSMIMRTNAHELDEIREWATGLGCDFRYDALIHPCLNQDTLPLAERLTPAEIAQFRHRDRERRPVPPHTPPSTEALAPRQFFFECGAGIMTVHIDDQHQAHPCISWREEPFDLVAHPTQSAWHAHIDRLRRKPAPGGACDACSDRAHCQSCVALSMLEGGSPAAPLPFFCELAKTEKRLEQDSFIPLV